MAATLFAIFFGAFAVVAKCLEMGRGNALVAIAFAADAALAYALLWVLGLA